MVSSGAARTTRTGLRWFVRVVAVLVGLANLSVVILWFVGGLYTLAGDGASLREALPSVLVTLIASVATSEIVLRVFELPGRSFTHRYKTVVMSMCLGGMVMGALLSVLYAIDGTMGADPSREFYADLLKNPIALLGAVPVGLVGAGFGLAFGLTEGLILGLPLAAALGRLGNGRPRPTPLSPSGPFLVAVRTEHRRIHLPRCSVNSASLFTYV
jgi:hypothetical protein